jgi:RNA polymerase sigma-70 factor (ECF subfamily)
LGDRAADVFEQRLVERFRQGDAEAMNALFEMHVDRVFAYARHLVGSREDAEEITSEAFIRALRNAADYRAESPFRGWLFGITRNLCYDRLRQPALLSIPAEEAPQEFDEERRAIRTDVRKVVSELADEYQDVLILCDVEEWDHREAAALLGRSAAATKSLLYRARRALRDKLTERWQEA